MGLKPSPYCTIKGFNLAFEIIHGDRRGPSNVFYWTVLILNLPGQNNYNPINPRVWKFNPITGGW